MKLDDYLALFSLVSHVQMIILNWNANLTKKDFFKKNILGKLKSWWNSHDIIVCQFSVNTEKSCNKNQRLKYNHWRKTINIWRRQKVWIIREHILIVGSSSLCYNEKDIIAFESCYRRQTSSKSCALISVNRSSIKSRKTWNWIWNRITLSGFS